VPRPPRGHGDIKHWKAAEFRSFLLIWGPIVMRYILPEQYYAHFLLLSGAMTLLLGYRITQADLTLARANLVWFLDMFEVLYGIRWCSKTIHSLLHLVSDVRMFGPLWCYSTFPFESYYHQIRNMIHGTNHVLQQLRHSAYIFRQCRIFSAVHLNADQLLYVRQIGSSTSSGDYDINRKANSVFVTPIQQGISALGRSREDLLTPGIRQQVLHFAALGPNATVTNFTRLLFQGENIQGTAYQRARKRCNHVVAYRRIDDALNFASIRSFHVVQSAGNGLVRIVCLAKRIQRVQESFATPLLDHEITAADLEPINHSFTRLVPLLPEHNYFLFFAQHIIGLAAYVHDPLIGQAFGYIRHNKLLD